ncbi:YeeE/YedE family protein [Bacteroidota bacterium]
MIETLSQTWPWYVAGPIIGLIVPVLLLIGNKQFGISENLRHMCAATLPGNLEFLTYDWKSSGLWNLTLILGVAIGAWLAQAFLTLPGAMIPISAETVADLNALGITDLSGLVPAQLISWEGLMTLPGALMIIGGGLLVGFGARYAGGCTSGHAISGLADLQVQSLVAVIGFFVGGLIVTFLLLPIIL